jgi:hypothetical protein
MAWINLREKKVPGGGGFVVGGGGAAVPAGAAPIEQDRFEFQLESCRCMIAFCRCASLPFLVCVRAPLHRGSSDLGGTGTWRVNGCTAILSPPPSSHSDAKGGWCQGRLLPQEAATPGAAAATTATTPTPTHTPTPTPTSTPAPQTAEAYDSDEDFAAPLDLASATTTTPAVQAVAPPPSQTPSQMGLFGEQLHLASNAPERAKFHRYATRSCLVCVCVWRVWVCGTTGIA